MNKIQVLGLVSSLIGWMCLSYFLSVQETLHYPQLWWAWVLIMIGYVFTITPEFRSVQ